MNCMIVGDRPLARISLWEIVPHSHRGLEVPQMYSKNAEKHRHGEGH
jgi:hypothetical protein